jgi:phosphate-selective porin
MPATAAAQSAPAPADAGLSPRLTSYLQVRRTQTSAADGEWALRRIKLTADGGPTRGIRYRAQAIYKTGLHSASDDRVILEDVFLTVPLWRVSVKVGQFIPPFGYERFQPDAALLFPERSRVTNQMVPNGNLGNSSARDRGGEVDASLGGLAMSGGMFQGDGANMPRRGNGPLFVGRLSYQRTSSVAGRQSLRTGVSFASRRVNDLNLSAALPGVESGITRSFQGGDRRLNGYVEVRSGRWRGQAELFRSWLSPERAPAFVARGLYGQLSAVIMAGLELGIRGERFTAGSGPPARPYRQLNAAVTYDVPKTPVRLSLDLSSRRGGVQPHSHALVLQAQWYLLRDWRL